MIQVCDLNFANSSITDTLGNYSFVSSGTVTITDHDYPANTDPILYVTDSSYNCIEFGQTATYSNGAIIQAGIPDYGSENWSVEFRARVTSAMPDYYGNYEIFYGFRAPYDYNGTTRIAGHWSISINNNLDALEFGYVDHYDTLTIKDNLDFTSWHLYKVTKTAEEILTLHIDGVLVATIDLEQQIGYKTHATLGSFALLGVANEFPVDNRTQTDQAVRLADVKVYADPMGHAEKAISLDNLSRVFRNYNTWLSSQLGNVVGDGTLTIKVNGTTAGTFSANQATAATANITVPTAVSELTNDSGYLTSSSNLDASKLTSGTVDIERLPQGALERLVKVANEAARYALTTADVQLGDTVQQLDTGIMYVVTDTDHLDSAAGYTEYTAGTAASVPWSGVTGKPTFATVATSGAYSDLTGTPTIPTVNDATLTIQQNGSTIDTFTANSSSDKTVNITVPTNTNELTNGAGFITADYAVPRSGGAVMTGTMLARNINGSSLTMCGGTRYDAGAAVNMFGGDYSSYGLAGAIKIFVKSSSEKSMYIYPSGTWTWDGTACQITSDQRLKQQITEIDDKLLDAWQDVDLVQFKYNDAVSEKGTKARLHTGFVVQQIDDACKKHGVDISAYGLYCHEVYPEETEEVEVEQADGTKTKETRVIREASEHYSLRYTEALIVECKYLRRCVERLTARIEELEKEREASK